MRSYSLPHRTQNAPCSKSISVLQGAFFQSFISPMALRGSGPSGGDFPGVAFGQRDSAVSGVTWADDFAPSGVRTGYAANPSMDP